MNSRSKNPRLNQADENFGDVDETTRELEDAFDARTVVHGRPLSPEPPAEAKPSRSAKQESSSLSLDDQPTAVVRLDQLERPAPISAPAAAPEKKQEPAQAKKSPWSPPAPPKTGREEDQDDHQTASHSGHHSSQTGSSSGYSSNHDATQVYSRHDTKSSRSVLEDNFDARTVIQTSTPKTDPSISTAKVNPGSFERSMPAPPMAVAPQSSQEIEAYDETTQPLAQVEVTGVNEIYDGGGRPSLMQRFSSLPKPAYVGIGLALVFAFYFLFGGSSEPSAEGQASHASAEASPSAPAQATAPAPAAKSGGGVESVLEQFDISFARTQGQIRPDPLSQ